MDAGRENGLAEAPVDDVVAVDAHAWALAATSRSMRSTTSSIAELGRVDRVRVRGRAHLRRVALVAQAQVGRERVGAEPGPLVGAPAGPLGLVGGEEDLHVGVGTDDRADVAALHDGVPSSASARWRSRSTARTSWWRATDETTRSISTVRISLVTSRPSIVIVPGVDGHGVLAREGA